MLVYPRTQPSLTVKFSAVNDGACVNWYPCLCVRDGAQHALQRTTALLTSAVDFHVTNEPQALPTETRAEVPMDLAHGRLASRTRGRNVAAWT